jgi:HAD superfamily hydrolase (TIGR01549 family)
MIKAILFDLWNTLVYNKSSVRPNMELQDFIRRHGVKNPIDFIDRTLCTRELSAREAAEHASKELGCGPEEMEPFFESYDSIESTPFPDVVPALERLRKGYKLAIISNISLSLKAFQRTGLERLFDYRFYSCRAGLIKQTGLFRHALREMGLKPGEAVMVGDCKFADIDPAERLGIRAVLIKREGFPLGYIERQNFKRTIKTLDELDKYLRP